MSDISKNVVQAPSGAELAPMQAAQGANGAGTVSHTVGEPAPALAARAPAAPPSAGDLIKQARESQGLHIAALAAAMKVPQRKLEALEANRWDELPDATFVRALAQSVCRVLKIDAKRVLHLLPPPAQSSFDGPAKNLNTPMQAPSSMAEQAKGVMSNMAASGLRPLSLAALLLAGAAVVMFMTPASYWRGLFGAGPKATATTVPLASQPESSSQSAAPAPNPALAPSAQAGLNAAATAASGSASSMATLASAPLGTASANPSTADAGSPPASSALGVAAGLAHAAGASVAAISAPAVAGAAGATASATPAAAPASAAAPGTNSALASQDPNAPIQISSTKDSWVTVRDANQRQIFDAMVRPGKSVSVQGRAPFSLVIGNSNQVSLSYKGKAVDIAASSIKNVARLQLP